MRTPFLLLLCLGAWSAVGQGTVDFRNGGITFPTVADRKVYCFGVGLTPLTGTNFVAGLWYLEGANRGGQIDTASQAGRTFTFRSPTTTLPGTWVVAAGASPIFVLDGVDIGEAATLQVRVWDGVKYASFAEARGAGEFSLVSAPFNYTVPSAGSTPDKYYMDNLRGFAGSCIPEPSTWTLLALAGSCLWWWRAKRFP